LHDARRLNYLPALRSNYPKYCPDDEMRKAIRELSSLGEKRKFRLRSGCG